MTDQFHVSAPLIRVNGAEQPGLREGLLDLLVEQRLDAPHRCRARFQNWGVRNGTPGFLYFDRRLLDFGVQLAVEQSGHAGSLVIFEGRISALEAAFPDGSQPEFVLQAEHDLQDLGGTRRTRTFTDMGDPDIFQQLAGENGLELELGLTGVYPPHEVLVQYDQTDLAFLLGRVRSLGWSLTVNNDRLIVSEEPATGENLVLTWGQNLLALNSRADLSQQVTELGVSVWDVVSKQSRTETADAGLLAGELDSLQSGSEIVSLLYGERREVLPLPDVRDREQAALLARAAFHRRAAQFVTARAEVQGDPRLRAGSQVDIRNVGDMFGGRYLVIVARHRYDRQSGYRCELELSRAGIGPKGRARSRKKNRASIGKLAQKSKANPSGLTRSTAKEKSDAYRPK